MQNAKRHFLTDAVIYGIGGVVIQLASVVLLPVYTHFLAPSDYGVMDVIERIGQIINICLMTSGVRQATFAFYLQATDQADRERVAVTITAFLVAIFTLAGLAILALSPILAPLLGIANPWLLVLGVVAILAELFLVIPLSLMQARVESVAFVLVSVLMLVVRIGLAVVFVAVMRWDVWGVYGSLLLTFVPFGAVLTVRELRKGSLAIDWQKCREIVRFSLPFLPYGVFAFVLFNGDRFFLLGTAGTAALGIYALGCKISSVAGMVTLQPLFKVWTARMYDAFAKPDAAKVAGRMLTRILTAYALVAVGLCLFHREALSLLSSEAYAGAGRVIAPMLLAAGCMFASNFMEGVFYAWRKTYLKPWTALIGAVITVGLYAALVPRYSILGAVYGAMLGYAAMALVTYVFAQRVFAVHYEWTKILVLVGLSSAVHWGGSSLELGIASFLLKCLLMLAWIMAILVTGVVSREDRRMVQRLAFSALARLAEYTGMHKTAAETPAPAGQASGLPFNSGSLHNGYPIETMKRRSQMADKLAGTKDIIKCAVIKSRVPRMLSRVIARRVAILRYHSVQPTPKLFEHSIGGGIIHSAEMFEGQMRLLAEHFHPVSLHEVDGFLRREGKLPARAVAVTFDDGFLDNFEIAAPILQRWGVPATFYVTVGPVGNGDPPWFSRARFAFFTTGCSQWRDATSGRCWPLTEETRRRDAFRSASERCAVLPTDQRDAFLDNIEKDLGVRLPADLRLMMDWEQVRALHRAGHIIGSHTMQHPNLAHIDRDRAFEELKQSKDILEGHIQSPVIHFSYPNPILKPHWTSETITMTRELGYRTAATSADGVHRVGDEPLCLRRLVVPYDVRGLRWRLEMSLSGYSIS